MENNQGPAPERVGLTPPEDAPDAIRDLLWPLPAYYMDVRRGEMSPATNGAWMWVTDATNRIRESFLRGKSEADSIIQSLRERVEELEKVLNNSKLPKMYVWRGRGKWLAMAHAFSVQEARDLLLEETGTTDGSCPVRAAAVEQIRSVGPTIFYSSNAEFALTDSGELEEADAYSETLKGRITELESQLSALQWVEVTPETMPPAGVRVSAWLHLPKNPPASGQVIAQYSGCQEDEPESYGKTRMTVDCWWANGMYYTKEHVTHWAPLLPPPPATGEKP